MKRPYKLESLRIRCTAAWKERVEKAAAKTEESVSSLIRQAVDAYLDVKDPGWDSGLVDDVIQEQIQVKTLPATRG